MHDAGPLSHVLGLNVQGDLGPLTFYTSGRGKFVWFPRAPPTSPPSNLQTQLRAQFSQAATWWRALTQADRASWELATRRARLRINGYNLWVWYCRTRARQQLASIERAAGITLVLPP